MEIGETLLPQSAAEWRAWLEANAATAREIWLVNFKKGRGRQPVDYETALDEATCFGWVDVMIKRMDDDRFAVRFVPRRPGGRWTEANLSRARRLIAEGRMTPQGLALVPAAAHRDT